jgi:hypothetical protein
MPFRFFRQQVGNDRAEQTKKSHGCEIFLVPLYQFVLTYFTQNSWPFLSPEGGRFGSKQQRQLGEQLDEQLYERLDESGFI